jgi:hypothetical protein
LAVLEHALFGRQDRSICTNGDGAGQKTCYVIGMLRFFNIFGRSAAQNALDEALRDYGVHPLLVPDAVKLTVLRLHKREMRRGGESASATYSEAAQLFAYCMLGRDTFIESNGLLVADLVDDRLEAAIAAGDTPDAKLILLAVHAGLTATDITARIDVEDI